MFRPISILSLLCGLSFFSGAQAVYAQAGPEKGGHELQLWTTGGYGVKGIVRRTPVYGLWADDTAGY